MAQAGVKIGVKYCILWMITKTCHPKIVITIVDVKCKEMLFMSHNIYMASWNNGHCC